jgi:hypothetical protein
VELSDLSLGELSEPMKVSGAPANLHGMQRGNIPLRAERRVQRTGLLLILFVHEYAAKREPVPPVFSPLAWLVIRASRA